MPSLATATQNRTNVNVNLAVRELEMRAATQATPQFRANYHEFHPASSEPQDFGVNTGEMVWTRVKDAPGAQRRANVFTSFNMMAFPLSNLEREGKNSLTRDEQAWLYAKSQYRCVGIAVKDTAYSKGSTHIVDPPVITVTGTIDILNLGPKSIKAMDLIMACIPTAAERRHPRVKGLSDTKIVGIPKPFDPSDVKPLVATYLRYFGVSNATEARLPVVTKRPLCDVNDAAEAFAQQVRYAFLLGALLGKKSGLAGLGPEELERAVGLRPVERGAVITVPDGPEWAFAQEYRGVPLPKFIMRLMLGLTPKMADGFTEISKHMSMQTRDLVCNAAANTLSAENQRISILHNEVIGVALGPAEPGQPFPLHLQMLRV